MWWLLLNWLVSNQSLHLAIFLILLSTVSCLLTGVLLVCLSLATRIVLVGPPGSKRKEIALGLTAHFSEEGKDFQCISVGDLITRQITQKNQTYGEDIEKSMETYSYVRDEIVIKLVK